ncbi:MAG: iron ABC transporter permease [Paracoccaceae bacterium]|nr:iron ABC transporter permease [Paracoccaceae bacterium]
MIKLERTVRDNAVFKAFKLSFSLKIATILCFVAATFSALFIGVTPLSPSSVLVEILNILPFLNLNSDLSELEATILWQWRLPRVFLGFFVGASLAVAGAGFQGIFRNPLADPFLLGSAAGAGLGATFVIILNINSWVINFDFVPVGAFLGALGATIIATFIGRIAGSAPASLLLAGVATASFLTACQTYLMQRNLMTLQEIYGWLIGRISTSGWSEVSLIAPCSLVCFFILFLHRKELDLLRLSEEEAVALGGNPKRTRRLIIVTCALLTAVAVSVSGLIAFVGIIVPHIVRLSMGYSYRLIIPFSFLLGGSFLVFTDIIARVAIAPAELPIGVITAFLGAPFFAFILILARGRL